MREWDFVEWKEWSSQDTGPETGTAGGWTGGPAGQGGSSEPAGC